jgi:UDP-glucose 4-epimerase
MNQPKTILVTGGGGFIGSHTCVALVEKGYNVVVVDDHSTSSVRSIDRIRQLAGPITAYSLDVRNTVGLSSILRRHGVCAVIHFAARKAVSESTQIPLEYFDVNIGGTIRLLQAMRNAGIHRLVFSSSCSIYGVGDGGPLNESAPPRPTNPYAWSKWICEQLVDQALRYHPELRAVSLRYFNPVGAHPSGVIGEDPNGVPQNVMPFLAQVVVGRLAKLPIFGDDYPTPDGTAIRDYIHVMDIADGHVAALDHIDDSKDMKIVNLGTGVGTSVLGLRSAFAAACGREIPYVIRPRRSGDVPELVADASEAHNRWGWNPKFDLHDMCRDAWNFQRSNPYGYQSDRWLLSDRHSPSVVT